MLQFLCHILSSIRPVDLAPNGGELLGNLCTLLQSEVAKENEYVMKGM